MMTKHTIPDQSEEGDFKLLHNTINLFFFQVVLRRCQHKSSSMRHYQAQRIELGRPGICRTNFGSQSILYSLLINHNLNTLPRILRCLRFLARQGLPLRGDGSDVESNFSQLPLLQCVDITDLSVWLRKKTGKYTSHDIQNEMLKIMAVKIMRQISQRIRDGGGYTVLADKCTKIRSNSPSV